MKAITLHLTLWLWKYCVHYLNQSRDSPRPQTHTNPEWGTESQAAERPKVRIPAEEHTWPSTLIRHGVGGRRRRGYGNGGADHRDAGTRASARGTARIMTVMIIITVITTIKYNSNKCYCSPRCTPSCCARCLLSAGRGVSPQDGAGKGSGVRLLGFLT